MGMEPARDAHSHPPTDAWSWQERVMGRAECAEARNLAGLVSSMTGQRIIVTGAAGSIGSAACALLADAGIEHLATDLADSRGVWRMDVLDPERVDLVVKGFKPTVIWHLAGAKHAPAGEEDPWDTAQINVGGTQNILAAAVGIRVVTASTCKACDPETAYGASKLIAERMTLNAGGCVTRFFNVVDTAGNVFEIWRNTPPSRSLRVMDCTRYFQTTNEAITLLIHATLAMPGRYSLAGVIRRRMIDISGDLHPDRPFMVCAPRRGDRRHEPRHATAETMLPDRTWVDRITGPHDAETTPCG